jgi:gliding motility-associated-like protein
MKKNVHKALMALTLLLMPILMFGQTPPTLGVAGTFVLFTSSGAILNVGQSQITGNVGSNSGSSTGFGNINGAIHDGDGTSGSADFDLNLAYINLTAQAPTQFPGILLGGGQVLTPGVFFIPAASTMGGTLTLDGQNDPNACFIFQMNGAFSADPGSRIALINGAKACNVFWKIDGATKLFAGTSFKGTIVCAGAISLFSGDNLDGRALSTGGAIAITTSRAAIPNGCGSPVLTGPNQPNVGSAACFALLTGDGALTNMGISNITGDVGTNNGPISGFDPPTLVTAVHSPDGATVSGSADITQLYNDLTALPYDIELTYPVLLGSSQVLTPHVYLLNAATHLTDTIFLDAQGNADAVFVFQINGALTTEKYSNVVLVGGTKASNVFWKVQNAATINEFSIFNGTIVAGDAVNLLKGDTLNGRALSKTGAVFTEAVTMAITPVATATITPSGPTTFCTGSSVTLTASAGSSYLWSTTESTQSIIVTTGGSYSVTVGGPGCGGSTSAATLVTVTPKSKPIITASGATTFCKGDSVTLTSSNALSYLWSSGENTQSITVDTTGNYSVIVDNSCGKDTSLITAVTMNPLPTADAGLDKIINAGDSTTIGTAAILGNTYAWLPTSGLSSSTLAQPKASPAGTKTYTLTVTSSNTCKNKDSVLVTVNGPLVNRRPVAINDTLFICKGSPVTNINVQLNDSDPDGDPLTTSIFAGAINGSFSLNVKKINYTPNAGFTGTDTINYYVCDNGTPSLCDSAKVILIVTPTYSNNVAASMCKGDSLLIGGIYRTTAGSYPNLLTTIHGCDSTVTTTLSIYPSAPNNLSAGICNGDSMLIAGKFRKIAGTYSDTLSSIHGCDSIINTTLSLGSFIATNNPQNICAGSSYAINGHNYSAAGNYQDTLIAKGGCDSIVTTTITVKAVFSTNNPQAICAGKTYTFNGHNYSATNTYKDTLTSVSGCDSVIVTMLTVSPAITNSNSKSICFGDSLMIAGKFRKTAGSYSDTLTAFSGCDSTVTTVLTVNPLPTAAFTSSITGLMTYSFVNTSTNAITYAWNFGDSQPTTSANPTNIYAAAGTYNVRLIATNDCGADTTTQTITTIAELEFFNGFSPNGDNVNDYWRIPVLDYYPSNTVTIINRWGSEVWKADNYDNNEVKWTGKNLHGDDLSDGTYFYIINYGNVEKRGWVFIKR